MRKIPAVVFAVLIAALSTIAAPAFACENDAQCKGDRVCSNGECVQPPSRAGQGAAPAPTPPGTPPVAPQGPPAAATAPSAGATMPPPPQAGPPGAYYP